MSAASDARERLEAAIWRALPVAAPVHVVAGILSAADGYARAMADGYARELMTCAELPGRKRLAEATAERTGRTG